MRNERSGKFRADIQGLRAIAVGFVLLYHAGVSAVGGGYVGVDVFFVISGFLITGHIFDGIEKHGRVRLGDFYARRARRILPAAIVVVVLTAAAVVLFTPAVDAVRLLRDALSSALYVPNIWFALQETDYLGEHAASPFQHYWSLGIEEQFYLFWPLVLWLIVLLARRRRALIVLVILAITMASLLAGVWLTSVNQPYAFFLLPTRAWELLAGGLVAAIARTDWLGRVPSVVRAVAGWVGLLAVLGSAVFFDDSTVFPGTAAIVPVVGTALVIAAAEFITPGGPTRLLSVAPMQVVGKISYSLYLVHWPLIIVPQSAVGFDQPLSVEVKILLGIVVAIPLAVALHRFVEEPLRAPKVLTSRKPRATLVATLAITALVAGGLGGTAVWAAGRSVPTYGVADEVAGPERSPKGTAQLPENLTPTLEQVADDVPIVYADGCHHDTDVESVQDCAYGDPDGEVRIAVFGDSHAAQWLPAVQDYADDRGNIRVESYTKSSCPAVAVTVFVQNSTYASCDQWRAAVLESFAESPPDLIVTSAYSGYDLTGISDPGTRVESWRAGTTSLVDSLRDTGASVLVIRDTPRFASTPSTCIATHPQNLAQCAVGRDVAFDSALSDAEEHAATVAGASTLDVTDYLCTYDACPVVIDNLLVYRDVNHLTVTAVRYLSPIVADAIDTALS